MRAWATLAVLFALVTALSAWVYYRPATPVTESYALSELKPPEIARIRLELLAQASTAAVALERNEHGWRLTAPFSARADAFQVERLLAILEARSAARYPATDLARYGLDAPQARLTLNDQTFAYGAVNAMTREQYVLTRDAVYAIPLAQRTALPRDANALISRALFAENEVPVRLTGPDFSAALDRGTWTITPSAGELSADERNAWAEGWRNIMAVQVSRYDGRAAAAHVKVELKDGRTVELGILQREPELVLVRSDEGIQYHFRAETAKRLLSPPPSRSDAVKP